MGKRTGALAVTGPAKGRPKICSYVFRAERMHIDLDMEISEPRERSERRRIGELVRWAIKEQALPGVAGRRFRQQYSGRTGVDWLMGTGGF